MAIRTASILVGASASFTGGTATSLALLSASDTSLRGYVASSGVTPLTRTEVTFQAKTPKTNQLSLNGYTQGRSSVTITVPKTLANLKVTRNTARVEFGFDVETTDAERLALKVLTCQLTMDGDFDAFYANQAVD